MEASQYFDLAKQVVYVNEGASVCSGVATVTDTTFVIIGLHLGNENISLLMLRPKRSNSGASQPPINADLIDRVKARQEAAS